MFHEGVNIYEHYQKYLETSRNFCQNPASPTSTMLVKRGQYYCSHRNILCNTESVNFMSLHFRSIYKAKNLKPYFIYPNNCNLRLGCVILRQQHNKQEKAKQYKQNRSYQYYLY